MSQFRPSAAALRAEAHMLTLTGLMLLAIGFPLTLMLVAQALVERGASPLLPVVMGAPPLLLGYLACHAASRQLARAKVMERR